MFSSSYKSVSAYQQVGVENEILNADPHKLIVLLYEGAIAATRMAKAELENGDIAKKGALISKAIDIVESGLKASLNLEQGGELAERLDALYDYLVERLFHANLHNDAAALDEVVLLLTELSGAWTEIREQVMGGSSS